MLFCRRLDLRSKCLALVWSRQDAELATRLLAVLCIYAIIYNNQDEPTERGGKMARLPGSRTRPWRATEIDTGMHDQGAD